MTGRGGFTAHLRKEEAEQAGRAALALRQAGGRGSLRPVLLEPAGQRAESVALPSKVVELLSHVLTQLAEGNAVTVLPAHTELTTQQAADLLNVSRPYLVQLLERGEMPFRRVGTRRRVPLAEVMAYIQREEGWREELHDVTERLGLPGLGSAELPAP